MKKLLKMGKNLNKHFTREENSQQGYETFPNINNHHGTANQNHNELSPHNFKNVYFHLNWRYLLGVELKGNPNVCLLLPPNIAFEISSIQGLILSQVKLKTKSPGSSCPVELNKHMKAWSAGWEPTFLLCSPATSPSKKKNLGSHSGVALIVARIVNFTCLDFSFSSLYSLFEVRSILQVTYFLSALSSPMSKHLYFFPSYFLSD